MVEPQTHLFEDDGVIPNHPTYPLLFYPREVELTGPDPDIQHGAPDERNWGSTRSPKCLSRIPILFTGPAVRCGRTGSKSALGHAAAR